MQINQQLLRFNQVLTDEINNEVLKTLSVHNRSLVSANRSLESVNQVLTQ